MKPKSYTVLQLADYGGPYAGNFIASLMALDEKLKSLGWRQVLVFSDIAKKTAWLKDLIDKRTTVYLVPKNIRLTSNIVDIAKKENVSIMHTHFSTFDMPAVGAQLLLNRGKKIRLFRHVHSAFPVVPTFGRRLKDLIKFRLFGNLYHSIYVSNALFESDLSRGLRTNRFDILSNGVDMTRLRGSGYRRDCLEKDYGLNNSHDNLLTFGWDPVAKGVDITLKACLKLAAGRKNFNLIIVGEQRLKKYVEEIFGKSIPYWLKILTSQQDVARLYQIADIFISASRYEGFSYSACEAMASGLPVIASDIEGLGWAHKAPRSHFFGQGDIDDLARKIENILSIGREERKTIYGENADFIKNNYSVGKWAEKLLSIYVRNV